MAGIKRNVVVQITSLRASAKVNGDLPDAKLAFADEVDGFVLSGGEVRLLRGAIRFADRHECPFSPPALRAVVQEFAQHMIGVRGNVGNFYCRVWSTSQASRCSLSSRYSFWVMTPSSRST